MPSRRAAELEHKYLNLAVPRYALVPPPLAMHGFLKGFSQSASCVRPFSAGALVGVRCKFRYVCQNGEPKTVWCVLSLLFEPTLKGYHTHPLAGE